MDNCINCGEVLPGIEGEEMTGCLLCKKEKVSCCCCGWCQECDDQAAFVTFEDGVKS